MNIANPPVKQLCLWMFIMITIILVKTIADFFNMMQIISNNICTTFD